MKICIEYDSCWQNSILDNKTISPDSNTRKFNKSKSGGNIEKISKNTVLGVLYRLIGDQRTLSKIKESDDQYFSKLENNISFELKKPFSYEELVMLINKSNDRTSDGKYIGVPKDDVELFFSENAPKLWSILYLNANEIMNFINTPCLSTVSGSSMPRDILNRIDEIQSFDPLETMEKLVSKERFKQDKQKETLIKLQNDDKAKKEAINKLNESIEKIEDNIKIIENNDSVRRLTTKINNTLLSLKTHFPETPREDYIKKGGEIQLIRLYSAALYLQAELMEKSGEDISKLYVFQTKGPNKGFKTIQGFSKKGFNGVRDFLNPLSTGGNKKTVKTPFSLTKASGQLEIDVDIDKDKAREIQTLIENAGVSSFYLGKKGLAYVSEIDTQQRNN
jgi:hypothetical protein